MPETLHVKCFEKLLNGELDETEIELDVNDTSNLMSMFDIPGQPGSQKNDEYSDIFGKAMVVVKLAAE